MESTTSQRHTIQDSRADRLIYESDHEEFDRLKFALRVLRLLAPPRMTVAVYESRRELRAERGHDLTQGPRATWGMLAVPRRASRREIVAAVAELAGIPQPSFIVDVLSTTWAAHAED